MILKKKILIVSRSFYPENSPRSHRTTELAKEFARQEHEVTVITAESKCDYSAFLQEHPIRIKSFGKLNLKSFAQSEWKLIGNWKRKFGRLLYMLFQYPDIELFWKIRRALKNENGYDLIISIAVPYPVHWGTAWTRTNRHRIAKIWVADCGDPFMGNTSDSFRIPFYFSIVEKWFCRRADYISIPVKSAIEGYYSEFHGKIKIIPQGFDFGDEIKQTVHYDHPVPTFAYAGGLAPLGLRSPVRLIEFLITLEIEYEFHIWSTTNIDFLQSYIKKSDNRIIVHESLPRHQLLPVLSRMDFLINLDNGTAMQVPSKLIDYALTWRPILNISPQHPEKEKILEFLNGNYSNGFVVENIDQYRIENVCNEFLSLLKNS